MSDKPVLVHAIHHLGTGGMEQVLLDTVNSLSDEFQHVVVSLSNVEDEYASSLPDNAVVVELHGKPGNDPAVWLAIYRILRTYKACVFHTYNIGTLEYQLAGFAVRVPLRVHAEHGRSASDPDGLYRKYLWFRKFMRFFVHRWIAVSEDLESWLCGVVGVRPSKVILARNGVDTERFTLAAPDEMRATKELPDRFIQNNSVVVGTVGRLDEVKNHFMLLEAISLVNQKVSSQKHSFKVAIVGDGPMLASLQKRARELEIEDEVWFTGVRHDVDKILRLFDLFVMSSDAEGIPIALLEAMASGVPVIVTNVGGMPEVVNKNCGMIIPVGDSQALVDALLDTIKNSKEATERVQLARARILAEYSQAHMVEVYRKVYRGFL